MKPTKLYRAQVKIIMQTRIDQLMNAADKQRTGLTKLTAKELANLGTWLDKNGVLAPGNQPG